MKQQDINKLLKEYSNKMPNASYGMEDFLLKSNLTEETVYKHGNEKYLKKIKEKQIMNLKKRLQGKGIPAAEVQAIKTALQYLLEENINESKEIRIELVSNKDNE